MTKKDVLLDCKKDLEQIKEVRVCEYKMKVGGEELGACYANRESTLHSPQNGVPILEGIGDPWDMIEPMEKVLGISSWIDGI